MSKARKAVKFRRSGVNRLQFAQDRLSGPDRPDDLYRLIAAGSLTSKKGYLLIRRCLMS